MLLSVLLPLVICLLVTSARRSILLGLFHGLRLNDIARIDLFGLSNRTVRG